ncbi:hypothetical protein T552_01698 [Pneumocystis carinii B80]|uniref:NADPH--cytochrome P450 reductase n=1 Tax=Pneumocystis carinii (strain B80) TaxID=1408658 RepID=A0A0W4ZJ82_PNEC8|nr:hypothetical protein T552_01698 [Pneumocystis carinii B80]KTW28435.1 hypothetical protein T552_01698 [Pneumocystis carinii B80]
MFKEKQELTLDTFDIIFIFVILTTILYIFRGKFWTKNEYALSVSNNSTNNTLPKNTRDIIQKIHDSQKNVIIFYGSQTGTAEDFAFRLAKEGHARFGLSTMATNFEDYDYENLNDFPAEKIAIFVVATYGEGEPTDNAVNFFEFLQSKNLTFSNGDTINNRPLSSLNYIIFGLGNSSYEYYNHMARTLDTLLVKLGANKISKRGEGDDSNAAIEEDFLTWKDKMWVDVVKKMNLKEKEAIYIPEFEIIEDLKLSSSLETVFLGELNKEYLIGPTKPFNSYNPFIAPVIESHELFFSEERNCLHMEFSIKGSGMKYQTGDHLAIWPSNPDQEVDRLLTILNLSHKRNTVIRIKNIDPIVKIPVPQPSTYDSIVRYYLEICGPVSRQSLTTLAQFAPSKEAKIETLKLGSDKNYFHKIISSRCFNLAQTMQFITSELWTKVPFSFIIECFTRLKPRYYSISSSSLIYPTKVHITAVVESKNFAENDNILNGVTTNYLLALKQKQNGDTNTRSFKISYQLDGPRNKYRNFHLPVYIRRSNFHPPHNPAVPIIMVGPGTGVAPFRAFIMERAEQMKRGKKIGKTILFYGCRYKNADFLYENEWKEYKNIMGDLFEMYIAFSRETNKKVYVQDLLEQNSSKINKILESGGIFYICGDAARMARKVNITLHKIISEERGIGKIEGNEVIRKMRNENKLFEDIWS